LPTLDIKDFHVNIPIKESINITKTQLLMHNDKHNASQIIMLLETILGQNYFTFQNQIYKPDKGVAMGSPISELWPRYSSTTGKKFALNT
jgi:hypothetical protein